MQNSTRVETHISTLATINTPSIPWWDRLYGTTALFAAISWLKVARS